MRVWLIVRNSETRDVTDLGGWFPTAWIDPVKPSIECVCAFTREADGWRYLGVGNGDEVHDRAMRTAWQVAAFERQ